MKISSLNYLFKQSMLGLRHNMLMSFASFCIMLVSLLLVGLSTLSILNINNIIKGIEEKNEVVVLVADKATEENVTALGNQLTTTDNIASVSLFTKEEAWDDVKKNMTEEEQELFNYADDNSNPMPDTYKIKISDISKMQQTADIINNYENVSSVKVPDDFATLFLNLRKIVTLISTIIVVTLIIICLVIISNTTRASVFSRRKEINIMKYVGANNMFIRIPFFIEGMTLGLLASGGALVITKYSYETLQKVLSTNSALYSVVGTSNIIPFNQIIVYITVAYVCAGVILGAFGTAASTKKYLKV